jgi:two-component system nitrate/nitrite response regulator NarL
MATFSASHSRGHSSEATLVSPVRVVIAEETPMSCQLLRNELVRSRFRFEIVACATNHAELLGFLNEHSTDVLLVSASLQDGPFAGFRVLKEVHTSFPAVRAIILLNSAPRQIVVDAFRAGAEGVICRTEPIQALCKCIQVVHQGHIWANSDQLHFVLDAFVNATPPRLTSSKGRYLLTQKEDEVAGLVAEGMTNRDVAQKLGIVEHTVSNYLFRIYEKLGISSRVELALYVIRQGRG